MTELSDSPSYTMITRIPSVNDTYFQHKVLSKIHGKPTYESLQNISTELKANASSVPSTLGGGFNGHLGLLLSDARYITVPNAVAWVTPGTPGLFVPPAAGTGPQIEPARAVWRAGPHRPRGACSSCPAGARNCEGAACRGSDNRCVSRHEAVRPRGAGFGD